MANLLRYIDSSYRTLAFVFLGIPSVFLLIMLEGAVVLHSMNVGSWSFGKAWDFMASASTGGAVVLSGKNFAVADLFPRLVCSLQGSFSVGMFGFAVAALNNSVFDPWSKVIGLHEGAGSCRRICILAFVFISSNFIFAAILGGIAALIERWQFFTGFRCLANIQLGGGIQAAFALVPPLTPNVPTVYFTVIGILAYAFASCLVAFVSTPLADTFEQTFGLLPDNASARHALIKFLQLCFLLLPIVLVLCMAFVACWACLLQACGILGTIDQLTWLEWFWIALPTVSGGAVTILVKHETMYWVGKLVFIIAASVGFFVLSAAIGIGGVLLAPVWDSVGMGKGGSVLKAFMVLLFSCTLGINFVLFLTALPFGLLMSLVEGWQLSDGVFWCVAIQLGGGMPLTTLAIDDTVGRCIAVFAAATSIGMSTLSVSLSSTPVVEPLIDAMGLKMSDEDIKEIVEDTESLMGHHPDHRGSDGVRTLTPSGPSSKLSKGEGGSRNCCVGANRSCYVDFFE